MADLMRLGIDFAQVAKQLEEDGIKKFVKPHDAVIGQLAAKSAPYRGPEQIQPLRRVARKLRRRAIQMPTSPGSGHPTSCMSCADIMADPFFRHLPWHP